MADSTKVPTKVPTKVSVRRAFGRGSISKVMGDAFRLELAGDSRGVQCRQRFRGGGRGPWRGAEELG
jgi:hypothetical protein